MGDQAILVLTHSDDPELGMLSDVPAGFRPVVGTKASQFSNELSTATIILHWSGSRALLREVFLDCPNLKWVHSRSAGLDTVLFPELVESPAVLTNGTGVFSASLGEFAVAAILYFAKDFRRMIRNQVAGIWEPFDVEPIAGKTLGIVGYGDIGRAVAVRAHTLGMRVVALRRQAHSRSDDQGIVSEIFTTDQLKAMLSACDYVVVSAPLTDATRGMIAEGEFSAMKNSAVLINVGRGPVIDEGALIRALQAEQIRGAALDVFDEEPLPPGHPFYGLENVLLSPHCADHLPDWKESAMQFFLEQLERFRKGEALKNIVEKHRGY